jgi:hypothetical protein
MDKEEIEAYLESKGEIKTEIAMGDYPVAFGRLVDDALSVLGANSDDVKRVLVRPSETFPVSIDLNPDIQDDGESLRDMGAVLAQAGFNEWVIDNSSEIGENIRISLDPAEI